MWSGLEAQTKMFPLQFDPSLHVGLVNASISRIHSVYCLRLLIAPFIEDFILYDRLHYLRYTVG